MPRFELLLKNGVIVDPENSFEGNADIGISRGKVIAVDKLSALDAEAVIDLKGRVVVPGIIDPHVHIGKFGHHNMAKVGVVTAVDFASPMKHVLQSILDFGAGMNIAAITTIGAYTNKMNPSRVEIQDMVETFLASGALGVKLIGEPLPLEAIAETVEVANSMEAYVALDCSATSKGSNIEGLREAVETMGNSLRLHIAHINSYCRGQIGDPVEEALTALSLLAGKKNIQSESYLGIINGTSGECLNNDPANRVTRSCLRLGGYPETKEGMIQAILDGYCKVPYEVGGETILLERDEALKSWLEAGTKTTVSFPVNVPAAAILLATKKDCKGKFIVNAISTDGGSTPRNVTVKSGLALVRYGAMSLTDFVVKTSLNPARMFGMLNKGHLGVGADADITVLDLSAGEAVMGIALGRVIMVNGVVVGVGGTVVTTEFGAKTVDRSGLPSQIIDLADCGLYRD
jgi:hypothetical protein